MRDNNNNNAGAGLTSHKSGHLIESTAPLVGLGLLPWPSLTIQDIEYIRERDSATP